MRERPILFSGQMVRAILQGRKTQTRRVVNSAKDHSGGGIFSPAEIATDLDPCLHCPHGLPGDRLWVREAWRTPLSYDVHNGTELAERCIGAGYKKPWAPIRYEADGWRDNWYAGNLRGRDDTQGRLRAARFMPRWASRILLQVISVRVQRLQDINADDAIAEGLRWRPALEAWTANDEDSWPTFVDPRRSFAGLWNSINGERDGAEWGSNPYVWAITFQRIET